MNEWMFAFRDVTITPDDGDVVSGNFARSEPHTVLFPGVKNLVCRGNWTNVELDPTWKMEGAHVHISFCSHLAPDIGLAACPTDCSHIIETDNVRIDGQTIAELTHRTYENKVVA